MYILGPEAGLCVARLCLRQGYVFERTVTGARAQGRKFVYWACGPGIGLPAGALSCGQGCDCVKAKAAAWA